MITTIVAIEIEKYFLEEIQMYTILLSLSFIYTHIDRNVAADLLLLSDKVRFGRFSIADRSSHQMA